MISAELVSDAQALQPLEPQWDDLAIRSRAPYCSPIWMLAWWANLAEDHHALRVVVVRDAGKLVGVAPFFADRYRGLVRYRLLAAPISFPVQPLAAQGHERSVAESIGGVLAVSDPRPDIVTFDGMPAHRTWASLLSDTWPKGVHPRVHHMRALPAPALVLRGRTYEEWLNSKSSNFRQQMRRFRRRLKSKGAKFLLAEGPEQVERGLTAFIALHHARWEPRGGSNLVHSRPEDMLHTVASRFADPTRFRLWLLDVAGRIISVQIFLEAGGELAYWNGGFDEEWAAEGPALQTIMAAIEHAFEVGDTRVSLGGGSEDYKYRFADEEDQLDWTSLLPVSPRYPLARLSLLPDDVRTTASNHLSDKSKQSLRQLASKLRSSRGAGT